MNFSLQRVWKNMFSVKKEPLRGSCYFTMLNGVLMLIRILNNMEMRIKVELEY